MKYHFLIKGPHQISVRGFVIGIILALMIIFELQTIIGGSIFTRTMEENNRASYESALEIYSSNLEEKLNQIDDFLLSSVLSEGYVTDVVESRNQVDRYVAQMRMKNSFRDSLSRLDMISGVIWYNQTKNIKVQVSDTSFSDMSSIRVQVMLEEIIHKAEREDISQWFFYKINGQVYLVRLLENKDNYVVGWINTNEIFDDMEESLSEKSAVLFLAAGKEILEDGSNSIETLENKKETNLQDISHRDYQVVQVKKPYNVSLSIALPREKIFTFAANPTTLVMLILITTIVFLLLLLKGLTRCFIDPMASLRDAMIKMQEGDFDVRIEQSGFLYEFDLLNSSFDKMANTIKELKIEVYEKQLEKQDVELQYLQHQINPHYLTNCLNTLYNLMLLGEEERAQQFIRILSQNIRYDLSTKKEITLMEELDHVRDYIALQQIRYDGQLQLEIKGEHLVNNCKIPNMVIQTFVENAVKHERCPDKILLIRVHVKEEKGYILIRVEDNGDGFDKEVIEKLDRNEQIMKNGVEHIGIENVKKRLKLMYKDKAEILFYNKDAKGDTGAVIDIRIPLPEAQL